MSLDETKSWWYKAGVIAAVAVGIVAVLTFLGLARDSDSSPASTSIPGSARTADPVGPTTSPSQSTVDSEDSEGEGAIGTSSSGADGSPRPSSTSVTVRQSDPTTEPAEQGEDPGAATALLTLRTARSGCSGLDATRWRSTSLRYGGVDHDGLVADFLVGSFWGGNICVLEYRLDRAYSKLSITLAVDEGTSYGESFSFPSNNYSNVDSVMNVSLASFVDGEWNVIETAVARFDEPVSITVDIESIAVLAIQLDSSDHDMSGGGFAGGIAEAFLE